MTRLTHALATPRSDARDVHTEAGTLISAAEVRARRIAREAERWLTFAAERTRMRPDTLTRKALGSCAFSVQHGTRSLAVPSKLVGTSRSQSALGAISRDADASWSALDVEVAEDGISVSYRGERLGEVQPKHVPWVRPLVPFGLAVRVTRVTGTGSRAAGTGGGYRLGCNVAFTGAGEALARMAEALAGPGGDGAAPERGGSPLRLVVPEEVRPIGVPVRPEYEALTGDPEDVVLWRTLEGEAHASIPHAARHSPTGIEWGYGGSGPADLARSVLLALTDEPTANALYHRFKHEVVASVPEAGGVLRAADVRRWVEQARCHAR